MCIHKNYKRRSLKLWAICFVFCHFILMPLRASENVEKIQQINNTKTPNNLPKWMVTDSLSLNISKHWMEVSRTSIGDGIGDPKKWGNNKKAKEMAYLSALTDSINNLVPYYTYFTTKYQREFVHMKSDVCKSKNINPLKSPLFYQQLSSCYLKTFAIHNNIIMENFDMKKDTIHWLINLDSIITKNFEVSENSSILDLNFYLNAKQIGDIQIKQNQCHFEKDAWICTVATKISQKFRLTGHYLENYQLGVFFEKGVYLKENKQLAYHYFNLSALSGYIKAQKKLKQMKNNNE
jgi:TPR repeat protein